MLILIFDRDPKVEVKIKIDINKREHYHFKTLDSTQTYLKKIYKPNIHTLVSTEYQKEGRGRGDKVWDFYPHSLAFSLTLEPTSIVTLTPLEVAILIKNFLYEKLHLEVFLKWPNDFISSQHKKCGGILCSYINTKIIIVGVGLNLFGRDEDLRSDYILPAGYMERGRVDFDNKELCDHIYDFILTRRLNSSDIREQWMDACCHRERKVTVYDRTTRMKGIFKNLSEEGFAIIEREKKLITISSGDLSLDIL